MMNLKTYLAPFITLVTLFILSGCQTLEVRGQFVSDKAIKEVNDKKSSKKEVSNIMGTPTFIPDYSQNTWYYIQRSLTQKAWIAPKVQDQRIVKVIFDNNDRAIEATILADMQNEDVTVRSDFTKTPGTEQTTIQKFVKNIGRFNKTTDGASKRTKKKK